MAAIPRSLLTYRLLLFPTTAALRRRPPPLLTRPFSSPSGRNTNSPASFDWSDDDDQKQPNQIDLPPPYDPFAKKSPASAAPRDPSDLQQIFHKMRTDGLTDHAVKMFDALSKDGLTHEALALFAVIKDKGAMPDVVAHTAVIEAYANAGGHWKDALRTFDRMLASGVSPNAYTYSVLVKGLVKDGRVGEARKYVLEMFGKGMRPNVGVYVAVFEAYLAEGRGDDAKGLLEEMRAKGFVPDEGEVRERLGKRGTVFRSMMSLLFGK